MGGRRGFYKVSRRKRVAGDIVQPDGIFLGVKRKKYRGGKNRGKSLENEEKAKKKSAGNKDKESCFFVAS